MKTTVINVAKVLEAGPQANSAQNTVLDIVTSMENLRKSISTDILKRDNNRQKIDKIISELDVVASRIRSIKNSVDNMANTYYSTDINLQKNESAINNVSKQLTSGRNESAFKRS